MFIELDHQLSINLAFVMKIEKRNYGPKDECKFLDANEKLLGQIDSTHRNFRAVQTAIEQSGRPEAK